MTTPNQCAILSIDPGATSGWALTSQGVYVTSGEVRPMRELGRVREVCAGALIAAGVDGLPLVMVMERSFGGTRGTIGGLGASAGIWKAQALEQGVQVSKILSVYTSTWRAAVLGRGWGNKPRDLARAKEREVAEEIAHSPLGPDESPAVCIGQWAAYCDEVNAKLPKRLQRVQVA